MVDCELYGEDGRIETARYSNIASTTIIKQTLNEISMRAKSIGHTNPAITAKILISRGFVSGISSLKKQAAAKMVIIATGR